MVFFVSFSFANKEIADNFVYPHTNRVPATRPEMCPKKKKGVLSLVLLGVLAKRVFWVPHFQRSTPDLPEEMPAVCSSAS